MRRVKAQHAMNAGGELYGYTSMPKLTPRDVKFYPAQYVEVVDYTETDILLEAVEKAAKNGPVVLLELGDDQYYVTWDIH